MGKRKVIKSKDQSAAIFDDESMDTVDLRRQARKEGDTSLMDIDMLEDEPY